MDWALIANLILSGMAIVFLVLILLILCVNLMGRSMKSITNNDGPHPSSKEIPAPATALTAPQPPAAKITQTPASFTGIAGETVAAIAGAIDAYMDAVAPGVAYAISSIASGASAVPSPTLDTAPVSFPVPSGYDAIIAATAAAVVAATTTSSVTRKYAERPVWGFAGMRQNTDSM